MAAGTIEIATARRLAALKDYGICNTGPEAEFDDIVFIASRICQAPVALVSLIEDRRQWFKAKVGIDADETPIEQSVCSLGLASTDLLIIPDLVDDNRTCLNPLVTGGPEIRFYAGAPLVTPQDVVIGMLCVIDIAPRPKGLDEDQQRMLRALARQVIALLEMRRMAGLSDAKAARSVLAEEVGSVGTFDVDIANDRALVSPELCRIFGLPVQASYPISVFEPLTDGEDLHIRSHRDNRTDGSADQNVEYRIRRPPDGAIRWISRQAEFIYDADGAVTHMIGVVTDVTEQRMLNAEISHRLKNTLALVQSIAAHTLRNVPGRAPIEEFDRRLMALSAAHDVLLERTQPTAPVRAVIDIVLERLSAKERTSTDGPHIELNSQTALILAMLTHELATNSMKYGALSVPNGVNLVRWSLEDEGETFVLDWREQGGPPAERSAKTGFGSRLISRGLGASSKVETRYEPQGYSATLRAPMAVVR